MLKKLLMITAVAISQFAVAQHRPTRLWDATFGGSDFEAFGEVKQTADGGYIMCGSSYSPASGDKTQGRKGTSSYTDFWVVKTDSLGNKLWDSTYGGRYSDVFGAVIETRDGGFLIGGHSDTDTIPTGNRSAAGKGQLDYWVIKINKNGIKQWDVTYGGASDEHLTSLVQTDDGGYIIGGYSDSRNTGDKTQDTRDINALRTDFWIVRTDSMGHKIWDATYGSNSHDHLYKIVKSRAGGYLLIGDSYSDAGFEKSTFLRGVSDYWVVKINNNGVKQWDAAYGGNQLETPKCGIQTADGGYLLGGGSRSGITFEKSDTSRGFDDSWLVKIDSTGAKQWDATFGGDGQEYVDGIVQQHDGGYIFATSSGSNLTGDKSQDKMGFFDYWVVRTDSMGHKIWDGRYGGPGDEYLYSMVQSRDFGLVLAGVSNSAAGADKSQGTRGGNDYWLLKLLNNDLHVTPAHDTVCIGSLASFHYEISGTFNSGNKVLVQLSDSNGNFTAFTPVDTLPLAGSGLFTGNANYIVPLSVPAGGHYRLRVITTSPADTFMTSTFRVRNCCAEFATPHASNKTGELYGTNDCVGENIYLEATAVAGATGYHWTGPNGFTSEQRNTNIISITAANSGTYKVYAYSLACTSATDSVAVTVKPLPPTPHATNGGPYHSGDTVRLFCSDPATTYQWTGPLTFVSSLANPIIPNGQPTNGGIYRLRISTNTGCWSLYDSTLVAVGLTALEELNSSAAMRLFPDPVQRGGSLTIQLDLPGIQKQMAYIRLYDVLGRQVISQDIPVSPLISLPVAQLPAGSYYLHLTVNDNMLVKKFIVE